MDPARARALWRRYEPYHAAVYFAPEGREQYSAAGLKGGWMGYFASRSAPLGAVPPEVVTATFYVFHPAMVARAIPDAWRLSSPERALAARYAVADSALRRLLGDAAPSDTVVEAVTLARRALDGCALAGRPIHAANRALPWPEAPHLALWHAATLLREHRFDGHVSALAAEGLDGCAANLTLTGSAAIGAGELRAMRGWSEQDWAATADRLRERGWVDGSGRVTAEGEAGRRRVEETTDRLATGPAEALGEDGCDRLEALWGELTERVLAGGGFPFPNPMGLSPAPAAAR
jgi:hypothetical protein